MVTGEVLIYGAKGANRWNMDTKTNVKELERSRNNTSVLNQGRKNNIH